MNNSAMFKIGYGLYILSAKRGDTDNACIINSVCQVTSTPNRIMIAINKQNFTTEMIDETGVFNISVLSEDANFDLFKRFGFQSGRNTDKFDGFSDIKRAENGILYVTLQTNAYISAKVYTKTDLGTHIMFIADVTDADVICSVPTASYDYYHKNIKPKPQKDQSKKGYRCKICGYVHESDTFPEGFVCPLCKHPPSDFEKI